MKKLYGLLVIVICLAACTANDPVEMTEAERAEIRAAVESQVQAMGEANSRMDIDLVTPVMALEVEMIDGYERFTGIEAIREHVIDVFGMFQSMEDTWTPVEVRVLNREWASALTEITFRRQLTDGRWRETNPLVYFTGLFQQIDGEWKLALGQWSGRSRLVEETTEE